MSTFEKVRKLVAKQLRIKEEQIKQESNIVNDLGADSVDIMEMLFALEEEYKFEVGEDDALNLKTVADIVSYIDSNK